MPDYPSDAPTPELAAAFPTKIPDPEQLVYDYVAAATADGLPSGVPALSFYADRARSTAEGRKVDVTRGWPAYPGVVPAIGVAYGPETEDDQHQTMEGGFAGTAYAYDVDGVTKIGAADYYAEPIYAPIIVTTIHENRDERDRLHRELRRLLNPIKTALLQAEPLVKLVKLDGEVTEQDGGPPEAEQPFLLYISIFTVHVYYEMLEARDVVDASGIVSGVDVTFESPAPGGGYVIRP